jgi:hypothetical protein
MSAPSFWRAPRLFALGLAALLTTAGVYALLSPLEVLLVVLAVGAGVVLILLPLHILPTIGFSTFVLFPATYLPIPTHNGALTPVLFIMLVFGARAIRERRPICVQPSTVVLMVTLLWIVAAAIISVRRSTSLVWVVNFAVLVAVPALFLPGWPEARDRVRSTWITFAGILGIYALIEFAISANPLFDSLYRASQTPLVQAWDVYRVTTTLGHPLVNGTFLSIGCVLGSGSLLRRDRGWPIIATMFAGAGAFLTFSRGAVLALAVGVSIVLAAVVIATKTRVNRRAAIVIAAAIMMGGVFGGNLLAERASGQEAANSTATRLETFEAGEVLVHEYLPWGAGPGLADNLKRELSVGDPRRGIESSWLQLLISIGIPGVAVIGLLILVAAGQVLRVQPEICGGLIAYAIAISTYNLIEANIPALHLLGVLLALSVKRSKSLVSPPSTQLSRTGERWPRGSVAMRSPEPSPRSCAISDLAP